MSPSVMPMTNSPQVTLGKSGFPIGKLNTGFARDFLFRLIAPALMVAIQIALTMDARSEPPLAFETLTTNGRTNPLGIAAHDISFGWSAAAADRGVMQDVYEVRVGTSPEADDVWKSGEVRSDRQVDVRLPQEITLKPSTRYWWQVKIRDNDGVASDWSEPAWFETGLLSKDDWEGAEWITRPNGAIAAENWKDYKVAVEFTLNSEALGVLLRATPDAQNGYMWQVNITGDKPVLKLHRKVNGAYETLDEIDLSQAGFTNESLRRGKHTLVFDVRGSNIATTLDGTAIDNRSESTFPTGLIGFRTYGAESATIHRLTAADATTGSILAAPDFAKGESGFTAGSVSDAAFEISGNTEAVFTGAPSSLPLLRRDFEIRDDVKDARLYASAKGLYELSLNGKKVGDQFLAPGWTDYDQRIQHQTYDVTDLVKKGPNAIGAALADGWYRGRVGIGWQSVYGDTLGLIAKLNVTYADGSTEWFATGPDWLASDGPLIQADLQNGETYDASREQPGWNRPEFDASQWEKVAVVPNSSARLVPQPDEPVRATDILTAKSRSTPVPGKVVYDLGQNMVGVSRITMTGRKGQTATIRYAEELYRTGAQKGQLYTDNFRSARVTDAYTFGKTGTITWQPTFTQHGFRYVEITGLDKAPAPEDVKGVVLGSDLRNIGDLRVSNPMLDQLVRNIRWGQRGNFLSIPTDTPARDERLGWTGDISVFAPTASRYQDTRAFLAKWMADVRDSQKENGNIPAVVPQPRHEFDDTGVGWSDAVITVPYAVWKSSGDARIVRENWSAMKKFFDFVERSATGDGDLIEQGRSCWFSGDWLSLEDADRLNEHKVIATAYFAENARMMAEMATAMGEEESAREWSALVPKIRRNFTDAFLQKDGSIYTGTQTAYAMALGMDLIDNPKQREMTAAKFVERLERDNFHLKTGFLGTPWLLPALSSIGRNDLAFRLLLNDDYPSWGFEVKMGATTMWERWNTIGADGEFGPVEMNSFNHYAYGAVGDWMFGNIGGLQPLEPGYKKSRIAPLIGEGGLTSARASIDTPFGLLASDWKVENGNLALAIDIPANTTAEVVIPTGNPDGVLESGLPAGSTPGVIDSSFRDGQLTLHLGSGRYRFTGTP